MILKMNKKAMATLPTQVGLRFHCLMYFTQLLRLVKDTKGKRKVKSEEIFPDHVQFVRDVRKLTQNSAFADVEVYRLKMIVTKLKKEYG